jgi:hypothetical protein
MMSQQIASQPAYMFTYAQHLLQGVHADELLG